MNYWELINGTYRDLWLRSMANNIGQLAQWVGGRIDDTNTVFFVKHKDVPNYFMVAYCKKEATIRPTKSEIHQVQNYAGGDRLEYLGPTSMQTASMTTTKLLTNSNIYTKGAWYCCFDIKNFY